MEFDRAETDCQGPLLGRTRAAPGPLGFDDIPQDSFARTVAGEVNLAELLAIQLFDGVAQTLGAVPIIVAGRATEPWPGSVPRPRRTALVSSMYPNGHGRWWLAGRVVAGPVA